MENNIATRLKKKMLIVTPLFLPLLGGMEEQCYLVGQEFLRRGYTVDILTEKTKADLLEEENMDGLNVYRINYGRKRGLLAYLKIAWSLASFLLRKQHEYDFCIIRTLTFHGTIVGLLKYLHLVKIHTIITAETGGDLDDLMLLNKSRFRRGIVFLLNQHDHLNSICEDNVRHYKQLHFDENKLIKLYNGIDVAPFYQNSYPKRISNFLFIGRLVKEKGIRELLDAFMRLARSEKQAKLIIAGDGQEKEYIANFIAQNQLTNVEFVGFVGRDAKPKLFASVDCVILPSYSEGFPISIIEATIYKRLIIATDVSDLKEIYGNNIIICEKRNSDDLYNKIIHAIDHYNELDLDYSAAINYVDIRHLADKLISLMA